MKSESGSGIVGLAVIALIIIMAASLIMGFISYFDRREPLHAAALLLLSAGTAAFLLKFTFSKE